MYIWSLILVRHRSKCLIFSIASYHGGWYMCFWLSSYVDWWGTFVLHWLWNWIPEYVWTFYFFVGVSCKRGHIKCKFCFCNSNVRAQHHTYRKPYGKYIYIYIYIYIYKKKHVYIYIYIKKNMYIYIYRERYIYNLDTAQQATSFFERGLQK